MISDNQTEVHWQLETDSEEKDPLQGPLERR